VIGKLKLNRRAFLYGAGGVAIGLPYLEGLPERSAWAAGSEPVFAFFMTAACGVEPKRFFPTGTAGSDTLTALLASGEQAVTALKDHAENLIIVRGVNYPQTGPAGCGHAEGLSQALTGRAPRGSGSGAQGSGASVDVVISKAVNPAGTDPITLYSGNLNNGFIEERLSFDDSGKVRPATDNPYKLYMALTGLATPGSGGTGGTGSTGAGGTGAMPTPMASELSIRRKSVNDLVRAELNSLLQNPKCSAADRQRLQQHFDSIRDVENTMAGMGMGAAAGTSSMPVTSATCSMDGIDKPTFDGLSKWRYTKTATGAGGSEQIVLLHMQLVALAFACNYNRVGSLQWGDGTDAAIYDVPSNKSLGWGLHYISHRTASDGALGTNATAEAAHAEIDAVRMTTFAAGLNHFRDRGLADRCVVMWNNHVAEGNHQMKNVPHVIWGNGGGYLKTNQYVDAAGANNATLLNVLISAATGTPTTDFGSSAGKELTAIKAA
jgi:uncharacterized protein DUF1552